MTEACTPQPDGGPPHTEWWLTVEITADPAGLVAFVDPGLAEVFARYLLDEGADAVALEHWRGGRREGIAMLGPQPAPPPLPPSA